MNTIKELRKEWNNCTFCSLHKCSTKKVFYRGSVPCEVLFIGEAPGKIEDALGEPFVGASGELLESMIQFSMDYLESEYTYGMTNAVACMPMVLDRGNPKYGYPFPPREDQVEACSNRLVQTLDIVEPNLIITLGTVATDAMNLHEYTFESLQHPSYWQRTGGEDGEVYKRNSLKLVEYLEESICG